MVVGQRTLAGVYVALSFEVFIGRGDRVVMEVGFWRFKGIYRVTEIRGVHLSSHLVDTSPTTQVTPTIYLQQCAPLYSAYWNLKMFPVVEIQLPKFDDMRGRGVYCGR